MKERSTEDWIELLEPLDIPCGPIHDVREVVKDPQVNARDMILELLHPTAGPLLMPGSPVKLSDTPTVITEAAPALGEHTDLILSSLLEKSTGEIHRLRSQGVIL